MANKSKIQSKIKWVKALRAWKHSGLNGSAFCRKNRLSPPAFYAWRRRLAGAKTAKGRDHRAFLPVRIVTSPEGNQPILELALKNGRVLRLYREVSAPVLAEMAHALEAEAC